MRRNIVLVLFILVIMVIMTACGGTTKKNVDAPEAVVALAETAMEKEVQKYIDEPYNVYIADYEVVTLTLENKKDITVDALNAMGTGAPTGHDVYLEFYKFMYEMTPETGEEPKATIEYTPKGKIIGTDAQKGEKRYYVAYNCDGEYTELYDCILYADEITPELCDDIAEKLFDVPEIDYVFWKEIDEYSFYSDSYTYTLASSFEPDEDSIWSEVPAEENGEINNENGNMNPGIKVELTDLEIESASFPLFNSPLTFNPITFMKTTTTGNPKTFRGAYVGMTVNELKRLYPRDLYELDVGRYAYLPEDETYRDISFFTSGGTITSIEMGCGVISRRVNPPYVHVNHKSSKFKVEPAIVYKAEVALTGKLGESGTEICQVDFKIPRVTNEVIDGGNINLQTGMDKYDALLISIKNGDYSALRNENLKLLKATYRSYQYEDMAALVITEKKETFDGDSSVINRAWYYDTSTGKQISAREYAKGCGLKENKIVREYNATEGVTQVKSIYEVPFYVDFTGMYFTLPNTIL